MTRAAVRRVTFRYSPSLILFVWAAVVLADPDAPIGIHVAFMAAVGVALAIVECARAKRNRERRCP